MSILNQPDFVTVDWITTTCCDCGVNFAFPRSVSDARQRDGKDFYCPNGHPLTYGEGEIRRLKRERDYLQRERDRAVQHKETTKRWLKQEQNSHRGTRGYATKLKNKIKRTEAGLCPHCKRNFVQLRRHMNNKHGGKK